MPARPDFDTRLALDALLIGAEGIGAFLLEVASLAGRIVTPHVSCAITVEYDGHPPTVAATDDRARAWDESQYEVDEGTCLHAMRAGEIVYVADLDQESRWARYISRARAQGLRSSLSLPLVAGESSVGAINLYDVTRTHGFDETTRRHAQSFAAQASTALRLAMRLADYSETNAQLEAALTSRSVIDQALGVLMAQERCTAEEAFALLRRHSQNNNRKLRSVAEELVARSSSKAAHGGRA